MLQERNFLILEVHTQERALKMSVYEHKEAVSTVRHYSQSHTHPQEITFLCENVFRLLRKANSKGVVASELLFSLKKVGQLLWDQLLVRSVKDTLRSSSLEGLVLSLDEELIEIPWELLYDGSDFLCLKFNLSRVVRVREKAMQPVTRQKSTTYKMLILANPTGDLESSYREGVYLKNLCDTQRKGIRIDFKSTNIDSMYVKKYIRDYDIVHFAGHCEYVKENQRQTGWVLADGRFTAEDILAIGETPALPALVFSHACQSAMMQENQVDGCSHQQMYSLASAFLYSGVSHYIGTICKIEDTVGFSFAKKFYSHLMRGKTLGESVRVGRLKLVQEYGITSLFWASYVLYGGLHFVVPCAEAKVSYFSIPLWKWTKPATTMIQAGVAALLICIIFVGVYRWAPCVKPHAYLSFLKSQKLFSQGKNNDASLLCKRIIEETPSFLAAYPLRAAATQRMGKWQEALKIYFAYALQSEKIRNTTHVSCAFNGIGLVYQHQGEYEKAFDFYTKALATSSQSRDKLNEAVSLRRLAVWYMQQNRNDKALELLTKSSEINRERHRSYEHRYNLACDYFDMGLVFVNKNDLVAAKDFYRKSLVLFQKMRLRNELSDYYCNLGEIYLFESQYQKAIDSYNEALRIDRQQGNQPNIASGYAMLGELYSNIGSVEEARSYLQKALAVSKEIDDLQG